MIDWDGHARMVSMRLRALAGIAMGLSYLALDRWQHGPNAKKERLYWMAIRRMWFLATASEEKLLRDPSLKDTMARLDRQSEN